MPRRGDDFLNVAALHSDLHVSEGRGERVAVMTESVTLTYSGLSRLVNKLGNLLLGLRVSVGDRVMISSPDSVYSLASFIAAMKIGAVPFFTNPGSGPDELGFFLRDSGASAIITVSRIAASIGDRWQGSTVTEDERVGRSVCLRDSLDSYPGELVAHATRGGDPAYLVYTSGTAGRPHGALHSHADLPFTVRAYQRVLGTRNDDVYYTASRLFFSAGRMFSIHQPLMSGSAAFLDTRRPTPERIAGIIKRVRPTLFLGTPGIYNSLARLSEAGEIRLDVTSLRACVSGGESLPVSVFKRWRDLTGKEILNAVGSSEAEWHYISQVQGDVRPESSGKVVPGWEAKLVGESGEIHEPGVRGTLWIRSPSIAKGYVGDAEAWALRFADGWFNTGDEFYRDGGGYFHLVGRSDDLFKVNGRWVSPNEVEDAILLHDSVAECAVVDSHDEDGLSRPLGCVVLKHGEVESEETRSEILEAVRGRLARYKVPSTIVFMKELPKTGNGKIQRFALRGAASRLLKGL